MHPSPFGHHDPMADVTGPFLLRGLGCHGQEGRYSATTPIHHWYNDGFKTMLSMLVSFCGILATQIFPLC